jgi:hypothetical protein
VVLTAAMVVEFESDLFRSDNSLEADGFDPDAQIHRANRLGVEREHGWRRCHRLQGAPQRHSDRNSNDPFIQRHWPMPVNHLYLRCQRFDAGVMTRINPQS